MNIFFSKFRVLLFFYLFLLILFLSFIDTFDNTHLRKFYFDKFPGFSQVRVGEDRFFEEKIKIVIRNKSNIFRLLSAEDFSKNQISMILEEINKHISFNTIRPGDYLDVVYDLKPKNNCKVVGSFFIPICLENMTKDVKNLTLGLSNGNKILINFNNNEPNSIVKEAVLVKKYKILTRTISRGFLLDAISGDDGVKTSVVMSIIDAYANFIDFQRDIRPGDKILFLIEYYQNDDDDIVNENIVYSDLITNGKKHSIVLFENKYYKIDGSGVKGMFLKTPIDGARLSSGFSRNRKHPILGYSRAHLGVDFAAPTGTPIYSSADGVVQEIGRSGGCGTNVYVRHANGYKTRYCHLSRFAKNLHVGKKVSQKEIIGYVGMTGLATGPHLHYEILLNNKHINPVTIKQQDVVQKLTGDKMNDFILNLNEMKKILTSLKV